jgi:hypothetical protein
MPCAKAMDALRQGDDLKAVATRFKVSQDYLNRAIAFSRVLPPWAVEAVRMYKAGNLIGEIKRKTGVTHRVLYHALTEMHVDYRHKHYSAGAGAWCAWCGDPLPAGFNRKTCDGECLSELMSDYARRRHRAKEEFQSCA